MSDQQRCPECRGTGAVDVRFPVGDGYPECPICGGSGDVSVPQLLGARAKSRAEKLVGPVGEPSELESSDVGAGDREGRILDGETGGRAVVASPAVPPVGDSTPDRQSGEKPELPGPSPDVPADLIDRAVADAIEPLKRRGIYPGTKDLRLAAEYLAPLLVAHGRQQRWPREALDAAEARGAAGERARWEARIEKQAAWEDRARAERETVTRFHAQSGSSLVKEIEQDEYRHDYTGRVLRSLLTSGEGGEEA